MPEMIEIMEKNGVPVFRTSLASKTFTTEATVLLEEQFAPRTTLHGTLLDIRGIGTLMRETADPEKVRRLLHLLKGGTVWWQMILSGLNF